MVGLCDLKTTKAEVVAKSSKVPTSCINKLLIQINLLMLSPKFFYKNNHICGKVRTLINFLVTLRINDTFELKLVKGHSVSSDVSVWLNIRINNQQRFCIDIKWKINLMVLKDMKILLNLLTPKGSVSFFTNSFSI